MVFTIDRVHSLKRPTQAQRMLRTSDHLIQLTMLIRRNMTFEARQVSRHFHNSPVTITANFHSLLNIHLPQ